MIDPAEAATHKVLAVFRALRRYSKKVLPSGITGRQIACIRFLEANGPTKVSDIAAYLFIGSSSASELIGKLQNAGLVVRTRSRDDNRKVFVELTQLGHDIAHEVPIGGMPLLRERLATLDRASIENIDRAFTDIAELIGLDEVEPKK